MTSQLQLGRLKTETQNPDSRWISRQTTQEILETINRGDQEVAVAVKKALPEITAAVDLIVGRLKEGGRLLYIGAGTSGRLGVLDASECQPTFGIDPETVQGIIAGGDHALRHAVEGSEDQASDGEKNLRERQVGARDVVVGIASSGRTPYVLGAMKLASSVGAGVIGICNNRRSEMRQYADITIEADTGPEVIMGSTRMKSGTSQKMILNMLSSATMIKLGKVYDNLMVDMKPNNGKLIERAKRMLTIATGATDDVAERALTDADYHVKTAIVMILENVDNQTASRLLEQSDGMILESIGQSNS